MYEPGDEVALVEPWKGLAAGTIGSVEDYEKHGLVEAGYVLVDFEDPTNHKLRTQVWVPEDVVERA